MWRISHSPLHRSAVLSIVSGVLCRAGRAGRRLFDVHPGPQHEMSRTCPPPTFLTAPWKGTLPTSAGPQRGSPAPRGRRRGPRGRRAHPRGWRTARAAPPAPGVAAGSSTTRSAHRPGSRVPMSSSRPRFTALPLVARWKSSCAVGVRPRSIATPPRRCRRPPRGPQDRDTHAGVQAVYRAMRSATQRRTPRRTPRDPRTAAPRGQIRPPTERPPQHRRSRR